MATFANATFNSAGYQAHRPGYAAELFETVYQYHDADGSGGWQRCVDLGCGTGQATRTLAERFEETIGVDPSSTMIETAKQTPIESASAGALKFVVGHAEELPFVEDGSVDMITASTAAHWFDHKRLWPELARVLKPSGTVAFWSYTIPRLTKYSQAAQLFNDFLDGPSGFGPYWEEPGYSIAKSLLVDLPIPGPPFDPSSYRHISYSGDYYPKDVAPHPQPCLMKAYRTWEALEANLRTMSGYHAYQLKHPNDVHNKEGDISTRFVKKLRKAVVDEGGDVEGVHTEVPMGLIMLKKSAS